MSSDLSNPIFHGGNKDLRHFEAIRWPEGRLSFHILASPL
jgi:hypothetical protein